MLTSKRKVKYAVVLTSVFLTASVGDVKARTAIGQASATVISAIATTPVEIRLQVSFSPTLSTSPGIGSAGFQSLVSGISAPAQPTVSLIGIDANGVASFSVSGAATSSYVVRPASSVVGSVETQTITQTGSLPTAANLAASLIVPAQTLVGGGRLSIQISQSSLFGQGGNMIVEINYN